MKKNKVVVIGSSNTDMVVKSERIPSPGETVIGGIFLMAAGGKGANQAVAAARLGADVTFIARVGTDMFGEQAIAGYRKEKIDTSFIIKDPENATGVALILVDDKGENSISVASGANAFLTPKDLEAAEVSIAEAKVIVTQLETPLEVLDCAGKLARKYEIPLILDPAPAPNQPLPKEIMQNVTYIKPNESETERLTGIKVEDLASAEAAGKLLLESGVRAALITLGSSGLLLVERNQTRHIPGISVSPMDTTAAGDAFSGALACGLAEGESLFDAARTATAVAALSVTRMGAQPSLPTREELLEWENVDLSRLFVPKKGTAL